MEEVRGSIPRWPIRAVSSEAEHPADNREAGESRTPRRILHWQLDRRSAGLRNRWLKVRLLPSALQSRSVVSAEIEIMPLPEATVKAGAASTVAIALVAQRQSRRLLTGTLQVRVLPGAFGASHGNQKETVQTNLMHR